MQGENQAAVATAQRIGLTRGTETRRDGQVALTAKVRVGGDRQSEEIWDHQQACPFKLLVVSGSKTNKSLLMSLIRTSLSRDEGH